MKKLNQEEINRIADKIVDILIDEKLTICDAGYVLSQARSVTELPLAKMHSELVDKIVSR